GFADHGAIQQRRYKTSGHILDREINEHEQHETEDADSGDAPNVLELDGLPDLDQKRQHTDEGTESGVEQARNERLVAKMTRQHDIDREAQGPDHGQERHGFDERR